MDNLPIKVLHICQRDDPGTGGAVRVAVEYVNRLQTYNVDAHCLFLYGQPGYFQTRLKERAHYLTIQSSKEVWKFPRLSQFLKGFKPDIVHHHDGLLWVSLITFIHPDYKKVVHAHLDTSIRTSPVKGRISAWLQRHSLDTLVCITNAIQTDYISRGRYPKELTNVISNGVDRDVFYPPTAETKADAKEYFGWQQCTPVVGYVGRLDCRMKGVDDFIRVIDKLPAHIKGLIVGEGPAYKDLKALIKQHGLQNRIHFAGLLQQTFLAYAAMDVFCLTSRWEPFGLVVAEAMACRVPVISFPCEGGVNELLDNSTGCVLSERHPEAMATAIVDILKAGIPPNKQKVIQHKILTNYSWDINTEKLVALYKRII